MIKRSTRPAVKAARPAVKSNSSAVEADDIPVYTKQEAGDPGEVGLTPVVDADYIDGGDTLGEVVEPPAGEKPWNGLDVGSEKYSDGDEVLEVDVPAGEAPVVVVHVANGVYKVGGRVRPLKQGKPLAIKGCKTHVLVPVASGHYAKAQILGKPSKSMSLFCRVGRIHYNGKGQAIFNQKSDWVLADLKASFVRTSPRRVDVKKVVSSILAGTGSARASMRPSARYSARPAVRSRFASHRPTSRTNVFSAGRPQNKVNASFRRVLFLLNRGLSYLDAHQDSFNPRDFIDSMDGVSQAVTTLIDEVDAVNYEIAYELRGLNRFIEAVIADLSSGESDFDLNLLSDKLVDWIDTVINYQDFLLTSSHRPTSRTRSRVVQSRRSLPFRTSRMTLTSGRVRSSKVALEQSLDVLRRSLPRASVRSRFERPVTRPSVRAPLPSRASIRLASHSRFERPSTRTAVRPSVHTTKTETRVSSAQTFEAFVASKQKKPAEQVTSRRKTQFDRNVSFLTSGM